MKLITINPNNEPYYSEDFIKGFKCGAERQFEANKADRPQGEWYQIKDHKVMGEGYLWHCSLCDHRVYQDSSADYPAENFCPNCGADMREREDK